MAGDLDLDVDFAALYRAEIGGLVRLAFLVCGELAVAEDAVSSAVARVLVRWRLGRIRDPAAYLRRAVINELTGGFRRRHGERRALDRRNPARPEETAPEDQIVDRDLLWRALDQLPVAQRVVIVLRLYEDLGETETATMLGISVGTVKSRLSRALQRLRVLIGEECLDA
jgi:RNA polymerase sigma-70 factor (sigma-E family)